MNGKCIYIGLSIHVVCIARHCRGETRAYMQNILFILLNALIYIFDIRRTLQQGHVPNTGRVQNLRTMQMSSTHTDTREAAMAKIECISKCISNRADAFRLFAILQWNCIASDARLSAFILTSTGFVSSARISKKKMQRLHILACVFGCAQAMHFKCFGQTQWKQWNKNPYDTDTHLSRFAIVGAFICPTLINSLECAGE